MEYVKLGGASILLSSSEWWMMQIVSLLLITQIDQIHHSLMFQIFYIVSSIPIGMQQSLSTLIGNSIGSLDVNKGKRYIGLVSLCNFAITLIVVIVVLTLKPVIFTIYEVEDEMGGVFNLVAIFMIGDCF